MLKTQQPGELTQNYDRQTNRPTENYNPWPPTSLGLTISIVVSCFPSCILLYGFYIHSLQLMTTQVSGLLFYSLDKEHMKIHI